MESTFVIVCKWFDKFSVRPPVTYVVKHDATPYDVYFFKLRGLYNPELNYYLMKVPVGYTDADIIQCIKGHNFKEPYVVKL